jgi:hypothetical protein
MHSSQFSLADPHLRDKTVVVIGSSHSGTDICVELVGHARRVINLFARTHLVVGRLSAVPIADDRQGTAHRIVPTDFLRSTRAVAFTETRETRRDLFKLLCPVQTNRQLIHPDLYVDLDDQAGSNEFLVSISDRYIELSEAGRIEPVKGELVDMVQGNGLLLADGRYIDQVDAVIFCTGYEVRFDFLEQSVLDKLMVAEAGYANFALLVSKYTFNPEVENLAVLAHVPVVNFAGICFCLPVATVGSG